MSRDRDEEQGPSGATDVPQDDGGRIPAPSPEEVPELLGERSDYPVPFGEERGGREQRPRVDPGDGRSPSRGDAPGSRR